MALAVFTATLPVNSQILINPANVVAVTPFNNMTHIHVAVPGQNNHPFFYAVTETIGEVQRRLNIAIG
jgi:hypothetical protein